ncbi:unnamed protein product, partial [Prorocentrum cordatum]
MEPSAKAERGQPRGGRQRQPPLVAPGAPSPSDSDSTWSPRTAQTATDVLASTSSHGDSETGSPPEAPARENDLLREREELSRRLLDAAHRGDMGCLMELIDAHGPELIFTKSGSARTAHIDARGPAFLTLHAIATGSGHTEAAQYLSEVATKSLVYRLLTLIKCYHPALGDARALLLDEVARHVEAGAHLGFASGCAGLMPLHAVCRLQPEPADGADEELELQAECAAHAVEVLAQEAPLALLCACRATGALPLEIAAGNRELGPALVPRLAAALGAVLLRHPDLARSEAVNRAAEKAAWVMGDCGAAGRLRSLVRAARAGAGEQEGAAAPPSPAAAFESWAARCRRLDALEPLLSRVHVHDQHPEAAESAAKAAELESLLRHQQSAHDRKVAELTEALNKAQRLAERAARGAAGSGRAELLLPGGAAATRSATASTTRSLSASAVTGAVPEGDEGDVIARIRRQRGLDLDLCGAGLPPAVAESAAAMQRSLGAAVERLARDLYTSRGHLVFELLQNADDNSYAEGASAYLQLQLGRGPQSMYFASVNNEVGMMPQDVEALCDVNRSSKHEGQIGRKGVGWKSVFAVSARPTVLSRRFLFCFDVERLGRLGYVTPRALSAPDVAAIPAELRAAHSGPPGATVVFLPLAAGAAEAAEAAEAIRGCAGALLDAPAWLLFLRRLRHLEWEDRSVSPPVRIVVERTAGDVVTVRRGGGAPEETRYLVHRRRVRAPPELRGPGRGSVEDEEVVVAFRGGGAPSSSVPAPDWAADAGDGPGDDEGPVPPVFCFLPVRPVGFRFLLHAPWTLTSNREDWHVEDPRNLWLREEAAIALAEALRRFGPALAGGLAVLDARRVVEPFWQRLLEDAAKQLGDAAIVPCEDAAGTVLARPSEVLAPTAALACCPGALLFLRAVPAAQWLRQTGKRLALLGGLAGGAVESARRALALGAEVLSLERLRQLLEAPDLSWKVGQPHLLSSLYELLACFLAPGGGDSVAGGSACPRLVTTVAELQQLRMLPLASFQLGEALSTPAGHSGGWARLADGDVFLPAAADAWCPGLEAATCALLVGHSGVRVLCWKAWRSLPAAGQRFLQRLGLREASLHAVAAAVARAHALCSSESVQVPSVREAFAVGAASELEASHVVLAGLEAIGAAHAQAFAALVGGGAPGGGHCDPAAESGPRGCAGVAARPDRGGLRLDASALGQLLWLPCTGGGRAGPSPDALPGPPSCPGEPGAAAAPRPVVLRRPSDTRLSSLLGVPAEEAAQEHIHAAALPARCCGASSAARRLSLRWEAFLAELGCRLPLARSIEHEALGAQLVSEAFWEELAASASLRKHAARVFRELGQYLSGLEIPEAFFGARPGPRRLSRCFLRSAFEPLAGAGALPYVDAPGPCEPLLELLRVP